MYKFCKSEQSQGRQRELEQGLLEAMLTRHYEDISVIDLCQSLKVPRKTFYRYFSGKDGALYSLIDHVMMDYLEYEARENSLAQKTPLEYMEGVCRYWMGCGKLMDALARSAMSGVLIQRAIVVSRELDSYPDFLRTAEKQMQDYGAMFASCGIMTMMIHWHQAGFSQSPEQMARLMLQLLSQPMFHI